MTKAETDLRLSNATIHAVQSAHTLVLNTVEGMNKLDKAAAFREAGIGETLQRTGLSLTAGFELEWVVITPDNDGSPKAVIAGGPYGADRLIEGLDYASALLEALDAAPEGAPSFSVSLLLAAGLLLSIMCRSTGPVERMRRSTVSFSCT